MDNDIIHIDLDEADSDNELGSEYENDDMDESEENASPISPYSLKITASNKDDLLSSTNCIVSMTQLLKLASAPKISTCNHPDCQGPVQIISKYVGTRVDLQWVSLSIYFILFNTSVWGDKNNIYILYFSDLCKRAHQ